MKLKQVLLLVLLLLVLVLIATQAQTTAPNGNVGIGTSAPNQLLTLVGAINPTMQVGVDQTNRYGGLTYSNYYDVVLLQGGVYGGTTRPVVMQTGGGNLGVGTIWPQSKLDVPGNVNVAGNVILQGLVFPDGTTQTTATKQGPQGPPGQTGATGPEGPQGPAGESAPSTPLFQASGGNGIVVVNKTSGRIVECTGVSYLGNPAGSCQTIGQIAPSSALSMTGVPGGALILNGDTGL